jgi:putative ABC transport system permease protein
VLFGAAVVGGAALSLVALRERGVVGVDGGHGGFTAASAPAWWTVAGALLVVAVLPVVAASVLAVTRRTTGGVAFFVAARVRDSGARALPLLVVIVTVAQLTFAVALTGTEQRGQAAGALLSVGGDARATLLPGGSATGRARSVAARPGVRAAVDARVEDDVQASSEDSAATVRLVVVDAAAYESLLAASALPDVPPLNRLAIRGAGRVPALLLGGAPGLRDGLVVRESAGPEIPLSVVGTAPRVQGAVGPVVVVDVDSYAHAGGVATPNTLWAVGPGAAAAVRSAVGRSGDVVLYSDVLGARRTAPLAAGLMRLSVTSSLLLLLFAVLAVAMAAAGEADPRAAAVGRLRSLGLRDRELWGVVAGEVMAPAVVGVLAGLVLGLGAAVTAFDHLSLERITGQVGPPDVSVPPWAALSGAVLVVTGLVLTHLEWLRLRRVALGQLLRGGLPR